MDQIEIGDKKYISTKRAAELTGYAKDYVGQLCREGRVEARLVGRSWYVLEESISEHRFGKGEQEAEEEPQEARTAQPYQSWDAPKYSSELPYSLPVLKERALRSTLNVLDHRQEEDLSDITNKQAVFSEEESIIKPVPEEQKAEEIIAVTRDAEPTVTSHEEGVPLHILSERDEKALLEVEAPPQPRKIELPAPTHKTVMKEGGSLKAALIVIVAITALTVMVVGTGVFEDIVPDTSIFNFLGGKSIYIK